MLADVADEVEKRELFHPVVVVDEFGRVGFGRVEVEEFGELPLDGLLIVAERLFVEKFALLAFHRRVANHSGGSSYECDGLMAGALKMLEHHDSHEVSDMQTVGCRVDAEVGHGHLLLQLFFCAGHHLVDHATPFEFFYEVHKCMIVVLYDLVLHLQS